MKKTIIALLFLISIATYSHSQSISPEQKFSPQQLKEDLLYLKQQLFDVHIYPYSELSKSQYGQLFDTIDMQLKDSLNATEFLKLVSPVIAYLSDEHANISLKNNLLTSNYREEPIFLPLILSKQGTNYSVAKVLSTQSDLLPGETITAIDNKPVKEAIDKCSLHTTGYPDQRKEKALRQFGYLYPWTTTGARHTFTIRTSAGKNINVQGITLKVWQDELNRQTGWETKCDEMISYQKFGNTGCINACSFTISDKKIDSLKNRISVIFELIQKDKLKYLFIDISKNSGGNSYVGTLLIDYIYDKSYRTYQSDWKKSEDYLKLLKSWGADPGDAYRQANAGDVLHFGPDTVDLLNNPYRFKGKVFVIVGDGTFSSAIMFATIIKDNHIAQIAGKIPANGHPNHFGELYNTKLPNTKIDLRFGVKEWIRPTGKTNDNELRPDILVNPSMAREELIKTVIEKAK